MTRVARPMDARAAQPTNDHHKENNPMGTHKSPIPNDSHQPGRPIPPPILPDKPPNPGTPKKGK
jgi:hypothetical protein